MRAMRVLYEDDGLLAVDKPAGVVVIPARDEDPSLSLRHRLEAARKERLWVVHRIDRDTSGVVLLARSADAHRALNALFETRAVEKSYTALTAGVPSPPEGTVDVPLHSARKGKMRPALPGEEGALEASTAYRVTGSWDTSPVKVARVEVSPRTGRQHQIRVHLRYLGTPLLVDPRYGRAVVLEGVEVPARLTLHASSVALPWRGATLRIEAPLAEDLAAFVTALAPR